MEKVLRRHVWGCFTYDKKGPCHIWLPETAAEKKLAEIEPIAKEARDMEQITCEVDCLLHNGCRGRKPQWKLTQKAGKLVWNGKGGIDWYRYRKVSKSLTPASALLLTY